MLKSIAAITLVASFPAFAQSSTSLVRPRITSPIDNSTRVTLADSKPPLALAENDLGAVSPSLQLHGISLTFSRTAAQQQALTALLAAQQDIASPLYHQWLTPDQFAAQFGVASSDIAAAETWLQQQGFTIDSVSRSRNRITFSGTAAQVASAFGARLHNFSAGDGSTQYAPSADISLPSALGSNVLAIGNLSSFRPHSRLRMRSAAQPSTGTPEANFTSSQSGAHYVTPGDLATIYDVTPAYSSGITGVNQSIAVVGQSAVVLSDVAAFQAAAGVTAKTPIVALVPNSGVSTIVSGDESESDLDLEYSSTIAYGAQVYFAYTGSSTNYNVFDSIQYAVDERLASIISVSYGACEPALGASNIGQIDAILSQGAAQGQTILSAAGDSGSTDCQGAYTKGSTSNYQIAVDYPASSVYVTAMGGSEFPTNYTAVGNTTYWAAQGTTDVVASAKSYIPEQVWNDDVAGSRTSSGGGGISIYETRPTWQAPGTLIGGVALPAGAYRLVPDISLDASNYSAPLAFCTSDTSAWRTAANGYSPPYQTSSCTSGFRDSSTQDLTLAGGTSFDGPIFSGMLALINQSLSSTGQGVINPTLYSLASTSTTYASAFHDITVGGNQCLAPFTVCGTGVQTTDYAASVGYDEASGLGSVDLYNLLLTWPKPAVASLTETTTTLAAATTTPASGAADSVTITVAEYNPLNNHTSVPTGSVSVEVDGSVVNNSLALSNGVAMYSFSSTTSGTHVITATYSGDASNGPSTGSVVLTIPTVTEFTLAASNLTVAQNSSGTSTVTITPTSGYTGTVGTFVIGYPTTLTNACVTTSANSVTLNGTSSGSLTLTFYTNSSLCPTGALSLMKGGAGTVRFTHGGLQRSSVAPPSGSPQQPWQRSSLPAAAMAGLVLLLGLGRRSRRSLQRSALTLIVALLAGVGMASLSGCSNSSAPATSSTNTPQGNYQMTFTATDINNASNTATANFTLTVN